MINKLILAILLTATSVASQADDILGRDKQKHFIVSSALGTSTAFIFNNPEDKTKPFVACMSVGILKEVNDSYRYRGSGFSKNDLIADSLGCYSGVLVGNRTLLFLAKQDQTTSVNIVKQF